MFENFAEEIIKVPVSPKGNYLKNCSGLALITDLKEDSDSTGKKAVMELLVLRVESTNSAVTDLNYVGEKVRKSYRFQDGSAKKRAAVMGDFKRTIAELCDLDVKTMTADQFKACATAIAGGAVKGMLLRFDPRASTTETGEARVYHNFTKVPGKNNPKDIATRADLLNKGAGPEAYL